jgi:hypothetical protein
MGTLLSTRRVARRGISSSSGTTGTSPTTSGRTTCSRGRVGRRALRYVGSARSLRYWRARGKGDDGLERDIIRYRLEFEESGRKRATVRSRAGATRGKQEAAAHRRRRPFDPTREPASYSVPVQGAMPEETAALQEKAYVPTTRCLFGSITSSSCADSPGSWRSHAQSISRPFARA